MEDKLIKLLKKDAEADAFRHWGIVNLNALIAECKQVVLRENPHLKENDLAIRFGWPDDFDCIDYESEEEYTVRTRINSTTSSSNFFHPITEGETKFKFQGRTTFRISKVDKHYAVILCGLCLGSIGKHLKSVEYRIGQKQVRFYTQAMLRPYFGNIFIPPDPIFSLEKKSVRVVFNTDLKTHTEFDTCPFIIVVIPAGA